MLNLFVLRRSFRFAVIVFVTVFSSHYFSIAEKFWIPMTALLVMQTPIGVSLHHGVQRFAVIFFAVLIGSLLVLNVSYKIVIDIIIALIFAVGCYFSTARTISAIPLAFLAVLMLLIAIIEPMLHADLIYTRLCDVTLGAAIGIGANLFLFPARADVEFRRGVVPVIAAYSDYLSAIADLLLRRPDAEKIADEKKSRVEKVMQENFPDWVYELGFNIVLRQGHRHFLILLERVGQILFSMHYEARFEFDMEMRDMLASPLSDCIERAKKMLSAIITVLELKKLQEGVEDFEDDISGLEQVFQSSGAISLEMMDLSKTYVYLASFINDLKDLRVVLMKLLEALG